MSNNSSKNNPFQNNNTFSLNTLFKNNVKLNNNYNSNVNNNSELILNIFSYFNIIPRDYNKVKKLIKSWIGIENLIFWKDGQIFLNNESKYCNKIPLTNCTKNSKCSMYKTKCVNKNTIKEFKCETIVKNQFNKNEFIVKKMYSTKIEFDPQTNVDFKYYMFIPSLYSKTCYIVFATGATLYDSEILNSTFKFEIKKVIEYIFELSSYFNNIVLCGHSLGCVLSQLISLEIIKMNKELFLDKIWIIGSAPFKWLNPIDKDIYNHYSDGKKIIFSSGFIDNENNKQIDYYYYDLSDNLTHSKIFILYVKEENFENLDKIKIINTDTEENIKKMSARNARNLPKRTKEINGKIYPIILHGWKPLYINLLKSIFTIS